MFSPYFALFPSNVSISLLHFYSNTVFLSHCNYSILCVRDMETSRLTTVEALIETSFQAGTVMFVSKDVISGAIGAFFVLEIVNASDLRDRRICVQ